MPMPVLGGSRAIVVVAGMKSVWSVKESWRVLFKPGPIFELRPRQYAWKDAWRWTVQLKEGRRCG